MKKFLKDLGSVLWRVGFWTMALGTWTWTYLVLSGDMKTDQHWVPLFTSVLWGFLVGMEVNEWIDGKLVKVWRKNAVNYKFLADTWEKDYRELVALIEKRAAEFKDS